jgi:hypothetical protein
MWNSDRLDRDDLAPALPYIIGAAGGATAAAAWLLRGRAASALRSAGQRLRPGRLRRDDAAEASLRRLEDAVLQRLTGHAIFGERGIDVGAVSHGIIELSGAVRSREEALEAVRLVEGLPGVLTVLNRMEVVTPSRAPMRGDVPHQGALGRNVGMGRMRQGGQTEPPRRDDSQWLEERALREADQADLAEWLEEDFAAANPQRTAPGEGGSRTRATEDELDNQDPHRAGNASHTLEAPRQRFNTAARVGDTPKPATKLALEHADLPMKPQGTRPPAGDELEA